MWGVLDRPFKEHWKVGLRMMRISHDYNLGNSLDAFNSPSKVIPTAVDNLGLSCHLWALIFSV